MVPSEITSRSLLASGDKDCSRPPEGNADVDVLIRGFGRCHGFSTHSFTDAGRTSSGDVPREAGAARPTPPAISAAKTIALLYAAYQHGLPSQIPLSKHPSDAALSCRKWLTATIPMANSSGDILHLKTRSYGTSSNA